MRLLAEHAYEGVAIQSDSGFDSAAPEPASFALGAAAIAALAQRASRARRAR